MHYLHVGYVGFVGNLNYMQVLDFVVGFAGIDLGGDDGRLLGLWPWEPREGFEVSPAAQSMHEQFFLEMDLR